MTIQALPQTAVRAIGANQALTDPTALVKELVDNALDARATSIAVEIHASTLDSIQVRDNGHGIPPQDRPLVARRYCTSKITGMNDLKSIGGSSLGFRGEALASAAEMSGSLIITTRVEGEQVATALKIDQKGEVIGQERSSTPVGTTVRITDFVKANPVRKQVMLKHSDQCLKKIKNQLQSFAFARPRVRLSLRVLKAKNDKGNWMYAPKPGGNAEDAAFKVVGAACASQCVWSVVEIHGYTLQAFLPKSDAAGSKIGGVGCFLSVDGRPLSTARGTPREILKIFRKSLKAGNPDMENVNDPFLYLAIACPDESYDANIEPAKDDILFEDADKVIEAVRQLFSAVYPVREVTRTSKLPVERPLVERSFTPVVVQDDGPESFTTSLEARSSTTPAQQVHTTAPTAQMKPHQTPFDEKRPLGLHKPSLSSTNDGYIAQTDGQPRQAFRSNMYGCDEDDILQLNDTLAADTTVIDLEELRQARNDKSTSNPWVMAKMNAPARRQEPREEHGVHQQHSSDAARLEPALISIQPTEGIVPGLLTPRPSSPSEDHRPFHPSDHVQTIRLANDGRVIGAPSLPLGRQYTTSPSRGSDWETTSPIRPQSRPAYSYDIAASNDSTQGTPLAAIPQAKPKRQAAPNRPFVPPMIDRPPKEKVWFDHIEGIEDRRRRRQPKDTRQSEGLVPRGELGDFTEEARILTPPRRNRDIRDFVDSMDLTADDAGQTSRPSVPPSVVTPKTSLGPSDDNVPRTYGALSGRGFVPASELAAMEAHFGTPDKPAAPPLKRRKTGDRALRQISGNAPPAPPADTDEEEHRPETASKAASRRKSSSKTLRSKSSRLPLERVPVGRGTHNIAIKIEISPARIAAQERRMYRSASLLSWNEPALNAFDVFGQQQDQRAIHCISQKLHELLINKVSDGEMVQDLSGLVQRAFQGNADLRAAELTEESEAGSMLEPTQSTQD